MQNVTENDDHIDKSQWLGNESVLVEYKINNKTVTARRDVTVTESANDRGGIEYRVLCRKTVLSCLYEADRLSADQFKAGVKYQVWRDYFAAQWSGTPVQIDLADLPSEGITSHLYALLLQRLHRRDQQLIDYAIDIHATPHIEWLTGCELRPADKLQAATRRKPFCDAFGRLHGLVDRLCTALASARDAKGPSDPAAMAREVSRLFLGDLMGR